MSLLRLNVLFVGLLDAGFLGRTLVLPLQLILRADVSRQMSTCAADVLIQISGQDLINMDEVLRLQCAGLGRPFADRHVPHASRALPERRRARRHDRHQCHATAKCYPESVNKQEVPMAALPFNAITRLGLR